MEHWWSIGSASVEHRWSSGSAVDVHLMRRRWVCRPLSQHLRCCQLPQRGRLERSPPATRILASAFSAAASVVAFGSRLPPRSLLLLRRGRHWRPAPFGKGRHWRPAFSLPLGRCFWVSATASVGAFAAQRSPLAIRTLRQRSPLATRILASARSVLLLRKDRHWRPAALIPSILHFQFSLFNFQF